MAMLAEKRTKTRYYLHHKTLSPRGNAWCEDSSKFGQRLLEKMGWSQGKGLGANEDGTTDPVHVSYKWDNKGMGFKGQDGDEAVAQQKDFEAFLATLSQENTANQESPTPEKSPKSKKDKATSSLEEQSQKSRARVHYHKFTRGKDLSRASKKDLACILGVPVDDNSPAPSAIEASIVPDVGPPIEPSMETTFGITTIARGNINEYFKQKYSERKRQAESEPLSSTPKRRKDDHDGVNFDGQGSEPSSSHEICEEPAKKKKKKKKKGEDTENNQMSEDMDVSTQSGRRKSVTWGDIEVSFVSKYIKDMVDTSSESLSGEVSAESLDKTDIEEEKDTVQSKKKKKKEKKKTDEAKIANGTSELEMESIDAVDVSSLTGKKKKKKKLKDVAIVDNTNQEQEACPVPLDGTTTHHDGCTDTAEESSSQILLTQKIKKKKKKEKTNGEEMFKVDASSGEQINSYQYDDADNSTPVKQKKKKSKEKYVNPDDTTMHSSVGSESEGKVTEDAATSSKKASKKVKKLPIDDEAPEYHVDKIKIDPEIKKKRKMSFDEVTVGNAEEEVCSDKKERKKKKRDKRADIKEDVQCVPNDTNESNIIYDTKPILEEEKKTKRRKKNEDDSMLSPDQNPSEVDGSTSKKKKKKSNVLVDSIEEESTVSAASEPSDQPRLSSLTQERMAKWKERRKNKDEKTVKDVNLHKKDTKASDTATLKVNPGVPVQDYNHRRVLSALGYNMKDAVNKSVTVQMPSTNFPGSNLDSLPGYGQTIKSH